MSIDCDNYSRIRTRSKKREEERQERRGSEMRKRWLEDGSRSYDLSIFLHMQPATGSRRVEVRKNEER